MQQTVNLLQLAACVRQKKAQRCTFIDTEDRQMKELVHEILLNFSDEMDHIQLIRVARQYLNHDTIQNTDQALYTLNETRRILLSWVSRDNAAHIQRRQQQALEQLLTQRRALSGIKDRITDLSTANGEALVRSQVPLKLLCLQQARARMMSIRACYWKVRATQTAKETMFQALERGDFVEAFNRRAVFLVLQGESQQYRGCGRGKADAEFAARAVQKILFESDFLARLDGNDVPKLLETLEKELPNAVINNAFVMKIKALPQNCDSIQHVFALGTKAILASTGLRGFRISREVYDEMRTVVTAGIANSTDGLGSLTLAAEVFRHFLKIDVHYQLTARALRALYQMRDAALVRMRDFFNEEITAHVHYAEACPGDLSLPASVALTPQEVLQRIAAAPNPFEAMCALEEGRSAIQGARVLAPKFRGCFSGFSLEFSRQWHQLLCFGMAERCTINQVAETATRYLDTLCGYLCAEMGFALTAQRGTSPFEAAIRIFKQHPSQLVPADAMQQMKANPVDTLRRGAMFTELLAWLRAHCGEALGTALLGFATEARPLREVYECVKERAIELAEQYLVFKLRGVFDLGKELRAIASGSVMKKQTLPCVQDFFKETTALMVQKIMPILSQITARHHLDTYHLWVEDLCLLFNRKLSEMMLVITVRPEKLGLFIGELQRLSTALAEVNVIWDPKPCIQALREKVNATRPPERSIYQ